MANRTLHKEWKNKRSGYTHRMRWYKGRSDVRLALEDPEGTVNVIVPNADYAGILWAKFRASSLTFGGPVARDVVAECQSVHPQLFWVTA